MCVCVCMRVWVYMYLAIYVYGLDCFVLYYKHVNTSGNEKKKQAISSPSLRAGAWVTNQTCVLYEERSPMP